MSPKFYNVIIPYGVLAVAAGIFAGLFVQWALSFEALWAVLKAPIGALDKIDFFWDGYKANYRAIGSVRGLGGVLFSWLFGINLALTLFVLRRRPVTEKLKTKSGAALGVGLLSTGCVTCGTSILSPLLSAFGATSASFLRDLSVTFLWLSVVLLAYSIHKLWPTAKAIYSAL